MSRRAGSLEHTPPPFFKRGPAPLVRLAFFVSLSLALLVMDARFRYADGLRRVLALATYPVQRAATLPFELAERIGGYFGSQAQLLEENAALRERLLAASREAQRYEGAQAEAQQLRRLIGAAERRDTAGTPAEILYAGRDPYSLKVLLDRGTQHGILSGSAVIDDTGVVGQVTRAHTLVSEVTLIIDKDQATPVEVVRNGLRVIAFGGGASHLLELRYLAANAEIETGDRLVTSGIDGSYPSGIPVATVVRVERDAARTFMRVLAQPAAGVERGRYVLVLAPQAQRAPYPQAESTGKVRAEKSRRAKKKDGDGGTR